eukprot:1025876-Alexandrium_andersonii.AAC.1
MVRHRAQPPLHQPLQRCRLLLGDRVAAASPNPNMLDVWPLWDSIAFVPCQLHWRALPPRVALLLLLWLLLLLLRLLMFVALLP